MDEVLDWTMEGFVDLEVLPWDESQSVSQF